MKLGWLIMMAMLGTAAGQTLTLLQDISSKLPTGSTFTAQDDAGRIYSGRLVTHHARRFLRRGSMLLVFDESVVPITPDPEGVLRGGRKIQLLKLGGSLALAKLADDAVDGAIGSGKARYVAAAVGAALIIFQKGSEAVLHRGDTIEVEPRRRLPNRAIVE